ncbi:IreB family regulatory phosphoprotein [uncultured Allofournierella sp.]|uniref:IreB family regulatory phosphoprotein n=1 Tax=uncultured Allofournierella sp. TaxID=1940258 RepID=UPI003752BD13
MKGYSRELLQIIGGILEAGYDPHMQIYGYLQTNDDAYITRTGNARSSYRTAGIGLIM